MFKKPDHTFKAGDNFFFNTCKYYIAIRIFANRNRSRGRVWVQQVLNLLIVNLNKRTLDKELSLITALLNTLIELANRPR